MNAKEALELSINSCQDELKEAYDKIKEASLKGETTITINNIKEAVESQLVIDGYCTDNDFFKINESQRCSICNRNRVF